MNERDEFEAESEVVPCGACSGRGVIGFREDGDPEVCDDCYGAGVLRLDDEEEASS